MKNITIEYTLNDKQQRRFNSWVKSIKTIHGVEGSFTWEISPTEIGTVIFVYSHITKTKLDLTDLDSW